MHKKLYWWEAVVLLRKLAVLVVAAVVVDPYLQVLFAIVVVNAALVLHVMYRPYDRTDLNNLETFALLSLLVTQVVSIMYV